MLIMSSRRLRALVAKRDWNEIEEIAKNKKSPIGWEVSPCHDLISGSLFTTKMLTTILPAIL